MKAPNTGSGDGFGQSVALVGGNPVVGAAGESSRSTGVGGVFSDDGAQGSGAAYSIH